MAPAAVPAAVVTSRPRRSRIASAQEASPRSLERAKVSLKTPSSPGKAAVTSTTRPETRLGVT